MESPVTSPTAPHLESCALSDVGQKRTNNEDSFLVSSEMGLYIVCDGMGGHAAGEVASALAVETVKKVFTKAFKTAHPVAKTIKQRKQVRKLVEASIIFANREIYKAGQEDRSKRGMGTTITLFLFLGNKLFIGHVGDSRGYLIRNRRTYQLTEDHTLLNELIKAGYLQQKDADNFDQPNALSRALGVQPGVKVDTMELDLLPNDVFVLCSDGLHGYLEDEEVQLHDELAEVPFSDIAQHLTDFANKAGGKDNVTTIAMRVQGIKETHETKQIRSSLSTLQKLHLFQGLDYKEYVKLFNLCKMVTHSNGEYIFHQEDDGDALYIVITGEVLLERHGQPLAHLNAGQHFGEMALIGDQGRSTSAQAQGTCTLLCVERQDFEKLSRQNPSMGLKLMKNLVRVLSDLVRDQSEMLIRLQNPKLPFSDTAASAASEQSPPPTEPTGTMQPSPRNGQDENDQGEPEGKAPPTQIDRPPPSNGEDGRFLWRYHRSQRPP